MQATSSPYENVRRKGAHACTAQMYLPAELSCAEASVGVLLVLQHTARLSHISAEFVLVSLDVQDVVPRIYWLVWWVLRRKTDKVLDKVGGQNQGRAKRVPLG
jgi:hypothetical protein